MTPRPGCASAAEDIWRTTDQRSWLWLVDDPDVSLRYLVLRGARADETAASARELLDTVPVPQAVESFRDAKTVGEKISGLYKLAVAAPGSVSAEVRGVVEAGFKDPDPKVRNAAIVAVMYVGSPRWSSC